MCPDCRQPVGACVCKANARAAVPAGDGVVRVSRETKGRGGKAVTVIKGVALDLAGLDRAGQGAQGRLRHRRHGQGRRDRDSGRPCRAHHGGAAGQGPQGETRGRLSDEAAQKTRAHQRRQRMPISLV